jgi:hypothetical protein
MAESKYKCPVCGSTTFALEKSKTRGFEHVDVGVCEGVHRGKACPFRFDARTYPVTALMASSIESEDIDIEIPAPAPSGDANVAVMEVDGQTAHGVVDQPGTQYHGTQVSFSTATAGAI